MLGKCSRCKCMRELVEGTRLCEKCFKHKEMVKERFRLKKEKERKAKGVIFDQKPMKKPTFKEFVAEKYPNGIHGKEEHREAFNEYREFCKGYGVMQDVGFFNPINLWKRNETQPSETPKEEDPRKHHTALCSKCQRFKPLTEFRPNSSKCKSCG